MLNHILVSQHGLKVAVIVNEIGEVGIDGELIISTTGDMVELSNGCICCSINNDLVDAVFRVLKREEGIDYLVVECTGVADPLPVVLTFLRSEFRDVVRVDSVITIADAANFSLDLFAGGAARNQIRYADTVLLNKCDLTAADRLDSIEEKIRAVSAGARTLRTRRCTVPLPLILSVGQFQSDRFFVDPANHIDYEHAHLANDGFDALSFASDRLYATDKFQSLLEQLPDNIFRAKGVIWLDASESQYVFHLVGQRFTLDDGPSVGPIKNKLVLIGRDLDHKRLRDQLENCLAA